jgi:hypothetical protein
MAKSMQQQSSLVTRLGLIRFGLTALTCLLSACAANTITLSGTFPSPLVRKLPLTVGVYYPDELKNYSFIEFDDNTGKDQYIIQSGTSQVELFNTLLPALFQNVVMLESLDNVQNNTSLDAVFVPAIEEFQLGLPAKTRLNVYEIWVKYNMRLSNANGDYIADWVMTAYGKAPEETFQSVDSGVQDAAIVAMRDLAASFTIGFSGIPEVNEWLKDNDYLNE